MAFFALILMIVSWRGFPETNQSARNQTVGVSETLERYGTLFRSPLFLAYSLNVGFAAAIFFAFVTVAPGILQGVYGLTPLMFSWVMVAFGLGFVLGGFISSRITPMLGLDRTIAFASLVVFAAMAVLLLSSGSASIWWILVPVFVYTVGAGALWPNSTTGATGVDRSIAGAAMSFMGIFQFSVAALGTYVVGNLDNDTIFPFATIGVFAACAILISASVLCFGSNRACLKAEIVK
jgi:DHA1 family bicyclomycin/chloramphenicol resistance-like MFS transporter